MWSKKDGSNDLCDLIGDSNWSRYSSNYTSATSDNGFTVVASNSTESLIVSRVSKSKPNNANSADGKKRRR